MRQASIFEFMPRSAHCVIRKPAYTHSIPLTREQWSLFEARWVTKIVRATNVVADRRHMSTDSTDSHRETLPENPDDYGDRQNLTYWRGTR